MAGDELVPRITITVLAPALGQHEFVLRFQHRKPPDFLEITGKAEFGPHPLIRGRQPSHDLYRVVDTVVSHCPDQLLSKHNYLHQPPIVNLISKSYYFN